MNRLLFGAVVLAMSIPALSCGDPTSSLRGGATRVEADPTSLFVTQGQTTQIIVRVLDEQGNELPDTVTFTSPSSAVTVAYDPTFLVGTDTTNPGATLPSKTRTRLLLTGVTVDTGHVTVSSGNLSRDIPFRVLPADASALFASAVSFSNTTPAVNEVVTMSATGWKFLPGVKVTFGLGDAIIVGVSPDSSTVSFIPLPGSAGEIAVTGAALAFLPSVPVPVTVPATITASATPLAGTNSPATAPSMNAPVAGQSVHLVDVGTTPGYACPTAGVPCQVYKLVVPAGGGTYDFNLTWSNTSDLGLYIFEADGTTFTGNACDANGNGDAAQPEICTGVALAEGTYVLAEAPFGPFYVPPDPLPDWFHLEVSAPGATGTSASVQVGDIFFTSNGNGTTNPAVDTVVVGGTVTWTWISGDHSVESLGTPSFTSSSVSSTPGNVYTFTFTAPGTYEYDCSVHGLSMSGRIVVE